MIRNDTLHRLPNLPRIHALVGDGPLPVKPPWREVAWLTTGARCEDGPLGLLGCDFPPSYMGAAAITRFSAFACRQGWGVGGDVFLILLCPGAGHLRSCTPVVCRKTGDGARSRASLFRGRTYALRPPSLMGGRSQAEGIGARFSHCRATLPCPDCIHASAFGESLRANAAHPLRSRLPAPRPRHFPCSPRPESPSANPASPPLAGRFRQTSASRMTFPRRHLSAPSHWVRRGRRKRHSVRTRGRGTRGRRSERRGQTENASPRRWPGRGVEGFGM